MNLAQAVGGPPWDLQQLSTGSEFHDETNGVGMIRNLSGVPWEPKKFLKSLRTGCKKRWFQD